MGDADVTYHMVLNCPSISDRGRSGYDNKVESTSESRLFNRKVVDVVPMPVRRIKAMNFGRASIVIVQQPSYLFISVCRPMYLVMQLKT